MVSIWHEEHAWKQTSFCKKPASHIIVIFAFLLQDTQKKSCHVVIWQSTYSFVPGHSKPKSSNRFSMHPPVRTTFTQTYKLSILMLLCFSMSLRWHFLLSCVVAKFRVLQKIHQDVVFLSSAKSGSLKLFLYRNFFLWIFSVCITFPWNFTWAEPCKTPWSTLAFKEHVTRPCTR